MHGLARPLGVEGVGKVDQSLAQADVSDFSVSNFMLWRVIEDLLLFLSREQVH